jgi:ABC-type Na+ efflux pump permease subunit
MAKLWAIAWKELYSTFTDRNLILIMIATPLAISSIVGLVFGGLAGGDVPIEEIPVAIVNHDRGNDFGANYGQVLVSVLVPGNSAAGGAVPACELGEEVGESEESSSMAITDLTEAVEVDQTLAQALVEDQALPIAEVAPGSDGYLEAVARAAVEEGEFLAAIFIPEDFTEKLTYIPVLKPQIEQTGVSIYANRGNPISAGVVRSIVEGIVNQISTGSITIAATFAEMQDQYGPGVVGRTATSMDMTKAFACAFSPTANTVDLDLQKVQGAEERNASSAILVSVGSAQAMFFALFTAQFGVLSLHEERRNWTLQRLVMTPTPRSSILAGKLVGVFITVLFQLLMLFLALTAVGSILQGRLALIWGSDLVLVVLVLLSASFAVSGLGMLLAGVLKSPEQAQVFGTVINISLAVLGGAFGFSLPRAISQLSLLYWGRSAFDMLAAGSADVWLNVGVLAAQGLGMFLIGLWLFNRRFEL